MPQLEKLKKLPKTAQETIEKTEKQTIFNQAFLPIKMKKLELQEATTGETLVAFKQPVETGTPKSILPNLTKKEVLILTNKNRINCLQTS